MIICDLCSQGMATIIYAIGINIVDYLLQSAVVIHRIFTYLALDIVALGKYETESIVKGSCQQQKV